MCAAPNVASNQPRYNGCRTTRYRPPTCRDVAADRQADARQLERVDRRDRARDDRDARQLDHGEGHRTGAVNVEQLSADRSPQHGRRRSSSRLAVQTYTERISVSGNGGGEPPLHAFAGEHAVVHGKHREQQHIPDRTPLDQLAARDGQGRPRTTRRKQSASRRTPPRRARRTASRIWSLGLTGHLVNHRATMTDANRHHRHRRRLAVRRGSRAVLGARQRRLQRRRAPSPSSTRRTSRAAWRRRSPA